MYNILMVFVFRPLLTVLITIFKDKNENKEALDI